MKQPTTITAHFCDDVRYEVNNKYSLIGCYTNELLVEQFPTVLPKLCVHIRLFDYSETIQSGTATIKAFVNDEIAGEIPIQLDEKALSEMKKSAPPTLVALMTFSPFVIPQPGILRVVTEINNETHACNSLTMRRFEPGERPEHHSSRP